MTSSARRDFDRPTVVFDLDVLRAKYRALDGRPRRRHHPLRGQGQPRPRGRQRPSPRSAASSTAPRAARSTSASALGVPADRIAFGNTIKRAADIAHAHAMGVEQFAVDAEEELYKIADARPRRAGDRPHAGRGEPGRLAAQPQVRLLAPRGAAADGSRPLPRPRRRRHLVPRRLADARARDVGAWRSTPRTGSGPSAAEAGHGLRILNIGGGFPAFYGQPMPATEDVCRRGDAHGAPPLRHRRRT